MTREEYERWIKEYAPAAAAARKVGNTPGWFPFEYIAATGGMIVKGGVLREVTRGPNKGQLTANGCNVDEVVVSDMEIRREAARIALGGPLQRARKLPRFSKVERTETTFFGVYRNHTFDLRQEGPRNWWYIRVTAPCGSYDYDGWWKDSEDKTVDDAILEAMAGAGMELPTKAASDKP